VRLTIINI
jgi:uncharacterized membrane protein YtjA (UPF0391 family)